MKRQFIVVCLSGLIYAISNTIFYTQYGDTIDRTVYIMSFLSAVGIIHIVDWLKAGGTDENDTRSN